MDFLSNFLEKSCYWSENFCFIVLIYILYMMYNGVLCDLYLCLEFLFVAILLLFYKI